MGENRENPIALRSKRRMMEALCDLMEEKPVHSITITELCIKAGLSRPAFYQNFDRIDDVLTMCIADRLEKSAEKIALPPNPTPVDCARACAQIAYENMAFASLVISQGMAPALLDKSSHLFADIHRRSVGTPDADPRRGVDASAFAGAGAAMLLVSWCKDKMKPDLEEASNRIGKLLESISLG